MPDKPKKPSPLPEQHAGLHRGSIMGRRRELTSPAPNIGDKVKFRAERLCYTVRAAGTRFAVCTKPFNPRKTVLYTVIDLTENIRGTENLIFGMGAEDDEHCRAMLLRLESGETKVSRRNCIALDIERIDRTAESPSG